MKLNSIVRNPNFNISPQLPNYNDSPKKQNCNKCKINLIIFYTNLAPFRTKKEQDASKCLRRLENEIVGRLYYNRNKSHSYNNFGMPHSTKNKNFFSPIKGNYKEKCNDENLYRTMKNDDFGDNVTITQGNFVKKNSSKCLTHNI